MAKKESKLQDKINRQKRIIDALSYKLSEAVNLLDTAKMQIDTQEKQIRLLEHELAKFRKE